MGGFDKLTINMAGVRTVDCGGLGSLASVLAIAVEKGKQVKITHASPLIVEMLQATKLEQFLDPASRFAAALGDRQPGSNCVRRSGVYFPAIHGWK